MGVMEPGTDRSRRESEELGDLGGLVAHVVAEHEDRAFVGVEAPEATVELVAIRQGQEIVSRGGRAGLADLALRPLGRFLSMYILKFGFLDGWRGFVLAVLYANYVFLRMAKAWETRRCAGEGDRGAS